MKYLLYVTLITATVGLLSGCFNNDSNGDHHIKKASMINGKSDIQPEDTVTYEVKKSKEEWRKILTSSEYRILRERGTELPYVNEYFNNKKEGVYYCGACGQPIFTSRTKYESGTGWPSFWEPIKPSVVGERQDEGFFVTRTEVVCSRCGSHLGHVFEDGPEPTGLRYCLNSAALDFVEMDLSRVDVENLPIKEKMASNN